MQILSENPLKDEVSKFKIGEMIRMLIRSSNEFLPSPLLRLQFTKTPWYTLPCNFFLMLANVSQDFITTTAASECARIALLITTHTEMKFPSSARLHVT